MVNEILNIAVNAGSNDKNKKFIVTAVVGEVYVVSYRKFMIHWKGIRVS